MIVETLLPDPGVHFSFSQLSFPIIPTYTSFGTARKTLCYYSHYLCLIFHSATCKEILCIVQRHPRTREDTAVHFLGLKVLCFHGYWFSRPVKAQWCSKLATYYNYLRMLQTTPLAGAPPQKSWTKISRPWCWAEVFYFISDVFPSSQSNSNMQPGLSLHWLI